MIRISVCIGSACHLKGSYNVISELQELIETYDLGDKIDIKAIFCMGHCSDAVSVRINDDEVESVSTHTVREFFNTRVLPLAKTA
jgi:NADH:ubiquinone oxidoreductase subunit E